MSIPIHLEEPAWLLLLLLAIPVAWTGLRWLSSMSMARRVSAVALRVALIALVAGILAGASATRRADRLAVVALVDVSGSVRGVSASGSPLDSTRALLERVGESRGPDDLLGVVAFDARALAVATPTAAKFADRSWDIPSTDGTDIESALRFAGALVPPGAAGRVLLATDGNQTAGDALAAAAELGARGIPVDVLPLTLATGDEVLVESVDVPLRAASGATITARVRLNATAPAEGDLRLLVNGEPHPLGPDGAFARRVSLRAGPNVELIELPLADGRVHSIEAVFEPLPAQGGRWRGDTLLANNIASATVLTPGRGAVLIVDGVGSGDPAGAGATLVAPLREASLDVRLVSPEAMPADLLSLETYDLVILQNVPASAVPEPAQQALASYVRDLGGGLVMVGGPLSFGAGAWKGTPLEPILPVLLDLPERIVVPEAAIVLVLDSSGSMRRPVMGSSRTQQEVANDAAAIALRSLDRTDLVGVIQFNNQASVVVPLGKNDDPEKSAQRVLAIQPDGGTDVRGALIEAGRQLRAVEAKLKHVVVLSDGQSQGAPLLPDLASELAADGIRVSTIAVGDDADVETLRMMADRGSGVFYNVVNPSRLPRVFLKVVELVRSPLVREGRFAPVMLPSGSPLTQDMGQPPDLLGLVLTRARAEPGVTTAMLASTGEPLLAHWPVELGQVAAFTSDTHQWATPWLAWDGFAPFWTRVVRVIGRAPSTSGLDVRVSANAGELRVALDAYDASGRPLDMLDAEATIFPRDGAATSGQTIRLRQTGPGLYEGGTRAAGAGTHVVLVRPRQGERKLAPVMAAVTAPAGLEARAVGTDLATLRAIAERSGGRLLDAASLSTSELFDRSTVPPRRVLTPLWKSLLPWLLVVLMLDIATRRIAWDRLVSDRFGEGLRKVAGEAIRERQTEAERALGALRAARSTTRPAEPEGPRLSEADARALAARQKAERLAARVAEARARLEGKDPASSPPASPQPPAAPSSSGPSEPESGLLAAKRRARERIEREQNPGDRA